MRLLQQFKKFIHQYSIELAITCLAVFLSGGIAWRVYSLNIGRVLVDQNSHLNLARQTIDSLTPGISQMGFWPPLLHILMIPFVAIDPLYHSGAAGFFTLLPFLIVASIFLYKTCLLLTENRWISFFSVLLFLLNPYVLYYTATPMMEILFIANLFATAYFMAKWLMKDRLTNILLAGIFISLSTLSRFEGIFLIPITMCLVLARLLFQRKKYHQVEALMIIFSILAVTGFVFILSYGYIFGGNPMAFMNSQWSAFNQQRDYLLPTQHSFLLSLQYFLHASYHILSKPLVLISLVSLPLLVMFRPKLETIAVALILFSPFLFDYSALVRGNAIVYVLELPPYNTFFNERYGLYWVGFIVLIPMLLIGTIVFKTSNRGVLRFLGILFATFFITVLSLYSGINLYRTAFVDNFSVVRQSGQGYPSGDQILLAQEIKKRYDFGKILITRALHDYVAVDSQVSLKNYIHESNYKYYAQALERPWIFARWVVMYNRNKQFSWALGNEKVSATWGNTKEFLNYYDLILENESERLYKVKDNVVIEYAVSRGYDPVQIPSINSTISWWNPDEIYAQMRASPKTIALWKERNTHVPSQRVKSQLAELYEKYLKQEYQNGYYVGGDNFGSSEAQSYALLQSYMAEDKDTFAKVWSWTKSNLQRKKDQLFSWKFTLNPGTQNVRITDKNSATDADTDIAFALLKAGEKWLVPDYIDEAKRITNSLWEHETASIRGKRIVTAGNWANTTTKAIINPSYFSPSAYRLFAKYDGEHDWDSLVDSNYEILSRVSGRKIRNGSSIFLPPNWVVLNKKDGKILPFTDRVDSLDYSYDAFRTFWRVAMDQKIHPTNTAQEYLKTVTAFENGWDKVDRPCTIYKFDSQGTHCEFSSVALVGPLSIFTITNLEAADKFVEKYYLSSGKLTFPQESSFYEKSWYWFGLSLFSGYRNVDLAYKN